MKIHVNEKYFARGKTGKGKFCKRLVKAWREMNIDVDINPDAKADIALHIGRMNYKSKARKNVLRVGPACIDTNMNWRKINKEKAQSVKKTDAIVYQSRYSKKIYHKLVCSPNKPEIIIFNGDDPNDNVKFYPRNSTIVCFLASTRLWLKQKRLKQVIKAFKKANVPNSQLIVCGDTSGMNEKCNMSNVYFSGKVTDHQLEIFYSCATALIHMTYIDVCPNSVVEAQVAGCPVICGNQGGTHEILRSGMSINDKPFSYKPIDLNHPPDIDQEGLINAMYECIKWKDKRSDNAAEDLYIQNIAKQYLSFFESIL